MAKKSIYTSAPKVPKKAIAAGAPMGTVSLGGAKSPTVPQKPPSIHGLDVPSRTFKTPSVRGAVKYGNVAKLKRSK